MSLYNAKFCVVTTPQLFKEHKVKIVTICQNTNLFMLLPHLKQNLVVLENILLGEY